MAKFKNTLILFLVANKNNIIKIGGLILFIIISLLIFFNKINKLENEKDRYKLELDLMKKESISWKDQEGLYRVRTQTITADIADLKEVYSDELIKLRNDFKSINKNYDNILGIMNFNSETFDSIKTTLITNQLPRDNLSNLPYLLKTFKYTDKWTTINGQIYENDDVTLNYNMRDSITFVSTFTQKKLLNLIPYGDKDISIEGFSHNPKTMISGLKNISVNDSNKNKMRVSISPQIGYGYTKYGFTPYAGIGLNLKY